MQTAKGMPDAELYLHCATCIKHRPKGVTPRQWNRTEAGINADGTLIVNCIRCSKNVITIKLEAGEMKALAQEDCDQCPPNDFS